MSKVNIFFQLMKTKLCICSSRPFFKRKIDSTNEFDDVPGAKLPINEHSNSGYVQRGRDYNQGRGYRGYYSSYESGYNQRGNGRGYNFGRGMYNMQLNNLLILL